MSSGKLLVLHVPKEALMVGLQSLLPDEFDTIVFAQWSEEKNAMMIGFAANPEMTELEVGSKELN